MGTVPFIHRIPAHIRLWLSFLPAIRAGHELRVIADIIVAFGKKITDDRKRVLQEGDPVVANQIARGEDFMSTLSESASLPIYTP